MEQNEGFFDTYFSFNGRLNRKPFIKRHIVAIFIMLILTIAIILPLYGLEHIDKFNLSAPYFAILLIITWFYLANMNRRFQDMNKSKKWMIFAGFLYVFSIFVDIFTNLLYPIIGPIQMQGNLAILTFIAVLYSVTSLISFALFIFLCCKKGTVGPNKYGPDPLQKDEDTQIEEEIK